MMSQHQFPEIPGTLASEAGPQTEASVQWSGFRIQDLEFHVWT